MPFKKNKISFGGVIITVVVTLLLSVPVNYFAQSYLSQLNNNGDSKINQKANNIEGQIAQYIENNGDKLLLSIEKSFQQQQQEKTNNRNEVISAVKSDLYANIIPSIGKKNAKHKLVEFYDYNCGYCKKAFVELQKIIDDKDLDIEVFFVDFPILGKSSELKAKGSLAAHLLDRKKYLALHAKLMNARVNSLDDVVNVAVQVGYDKGEFSDKVSSAKIDEILKNNRSLAQKLYVQGTPAFILNDKFVDGLVTYKSIKKLISQ